MVGKLLVAQLLLGASGMIPDTARVLLYLENALSYNTARPSGENDGSWWQGRGWNGLLRFGMRRERGPWTVAVGLEGWRSENRSFPLSPFRGADAQDRSLYAYPLRERVLDWPQRWGDRGAGGWYASETYLRFSRGHLAIGAGFRSRWIGPGRLNALFWSTHAPAYPHLWGETARPLSAGSLRLEVLGWVGQLRESRFYDVNPRNDRRLISGLLGQAHLLARDQVLTLGLVSIAYRTWVGVEEVAGAPLHALSLPLRSRWAPWTGLYGFFLRWRLPEDGAECYLEWARNEPAENLRDWLTYWVRGTAFTLGVEKQWVLRNPGTIYLRMELTRLESAKTDLVRPQKAFYTDSVVVQGYTHRGQALGAWIGPGSNSQWAQLRLERRGANVSLWVLRWAIDNDRFYRIHAPERNPTHFQKHETELRVGLEVGWRSRFWAVSAIFWHAVLYNRYYRLREEIPNRYVGVRLMRWWRL